MQSSTQTVAVSTGSPWAGRVVSALPALFMAVDGAMKLARPAPVLDSFTQLGFPEHLAVAIGILELVCVAVYLYPRTAILGALLLTGYLGGAIATQVRAEADLFPLIFPIILGVLVWGGRLMRDERLRALIPLRS